MTQPVVAVHTIVPAGWSYMPLGDGSCGSKPSIHCISHGYFEVTIYEQQPTNYGRDQWQNLMWRIPQGNQQSRSTGLVTGRLSYGPLRPSRGRRALRYDIPASYNSGE